MMTINHAILHVFDFVSAVDAIASEELDFTDKAAKSAKSFVEKTVRHAATSIDNKHGVFFEDSPFADELQAYARGERPFVEFSQQIADFMGSELGRADKQVSTDLLVVDYQDDPDDAPLDGEDLTEAQAAALCQARSRRCFGILLLESKQSFMHEVGRGAGARNDIVRRYAVLPNPSQKLSSYAIVDLASGKILLQDKERSIAGEKRALLADGLLQCSVNASEKEKFAEVEDVVEAVAEEFGANSAVAAAKAKAYAVENADANDDFDLRELGRAAFDDDPHLQDRFGEAAAERDLPERVSIDRGTVKRVAKSHKIRTDTGIEITFPAEYSRNPDFIEFVNEPNGLISIELKNIGSIENR